MFLGRIPSGVKRKGAVCNWARRGRANLEKRFVKKFRMEVGRTGGGKTALFHPIEIFFRRGGFFKSFYNSAARGAQDTLNVVKTNFQQLVLLPPLCPLSNSVSPLILWTFSRLMCV